MQESCMPGTHGKGNQNLGVRVNRVEQSSGVRVPELDAAVSSAAARGKQIGLEWTPGQSLDGCAVCGETVGATPG